MHSRRSDSSESSARNFPSLQKDSVAVAMYVHSRWCLVLYAQLPNALCHHLRSRADPSAGPDVEDSRTALASATRTACGQTTAHKRSEQAIRTAEPQVQFPQHHAHISSIYKLCHSRHNPHYIGSYYNTFLSTLALISFVRCPNSHAPLVKPVATACTAIFNITRHRQ